MSRASRRREERAGGAVRPSAGRHRGPLLIMTGSVLAALLVLGIIARGSEVASHHPTPRVDAQASSVMPAASYASSPRAAEVYAMAAQIPAVLDGLFCYCLCRSTFNHYSLLDCFRDDHAAGCDVCLDEAQIAYEMTRQGRSLDDIRQQIDARYGQA